MEPFLLTATERTIFDSLPESLREGWEIQEETLTWADAPEKIQMRMQLVSLHDPKLLRFIDSTRAEISPEGLATILLAADLSGVDDGDLEELFFALGPSIVSLVIEDMLKNVKTDSDVEDVQALTIIRHTLLVAFQPVA